MSEFMLCTDILVNKLECIKEKLIPRSGNVEGPKNVLKHESGSSITM